MKSHEAVLLLMVTLPPFVFGSTCPYTYRTEDRWCPKCEPGFRVDQNCTKFYNTKCLPCDDGTYRDECTEKTECLRCTSCDSGVGLVQLRSCSSSSNSVCGPRPGFFCHQHKNESGGCKAAQKHSTCSPGQRVQQPGSSSADTVCEDCPEGHFSSTGLNCTAWTICPHSQVALRPGSSEEDVVCGGEVRLHFILSISFVGVALILIAAVVAIICYCHRRGPGACEEYLI